MSDIRAEIEDVIDNRRFDSDFPKINFKDVQKIAEYVEPLLEKKIREARNNEAGNIYKIGMDIVMKRPASAVVAGGTDLDKFLNELERKYGKDLIQWVYGDHNSAALKEPTNE